MVLTVFRCRNKFRSIDLSGRKFPTGIKPRRVRETLQIVLEFKFEIGVVKPFGLIGNIAVMNYVVEHIDAVGLHRRVNGDASAVGCGNHVRIRFLRVRPVAYIAVHSLGRFVNLHGIELGF